MHDKHVKRKKNTLVRKKDIHISKNSTNMNKLENYRYGLL